MKIGKYWIWFVYDSNMQSCLTDEVHISVEIHVGCQFYSLFRKEFTTIKYIG